MSDELKTARRSKALLQTLSTDFLLREQFVTDPAGMHSEYVHRKTGSTAARDTANQLIYAIVSNPGMLEWLQSRATASESGSLSNAELADELAEAIGRNGDPAIVASLIKAGASKQASVGVALDLLRAIVVAGREVGRAGTEFTPGTGTQFTPGTGTQSTPARGTEFTPGAGTQSTPASGTEFTPGTGTQFTPGTGTQFTPGGITDRWGELQVVLQSLVDYATQLRRAGALNHTGLG
ncbi:hypothetical protein [Jatrophihabitans sp.]|uniref:hypothetical protein n=1 Tax=Jatrophihabitans sp. TaxID=1932789 RepID=UPI002EEADAC6